VVPVHYVIEGDRIAGIAGQGLDVAPGTMAAEMVRRGFRATLDTTSLLTGGKVVALRYVADAPAEQIGVQGDTFVVPSSETGGLDAITHSAAELLTKINSIDFAAIGKSLSGSVKGLDDIVNGPQLKKTLAALEATMADAQDFMRKLDTDSGPALARLPQIAKALDDSLVQINRLAASFNTGYGDNSRFSREIDRLLPQLNEMTRSFRALADLLTRHPEALIQGRTNKGKE
jgi:paraquat-inducible protein B